MNLFLRNSATNFACELELPECLHDTHIVFNSFVDAKKVIDANDQQIILCNGLKSASDKEFEFLWRKMQASENQEERLVLINALACYNKDYALKDFLESTIDNFVETQYFSHEPLEVIKAVSKQSVGFEVALNFLIEYNDHNISKHYQKNMNEVIEEISMKIISQNNVYKVRWS